MHPVTNVVPLSLVLLVSLIKEAFEDWVSITVHACHSVLLSFFFTPTCAWASSISFISLILIYVVFWSPGDRVVERLA